MLKYKEISDDILGKESLDLDFKKKLYEKYLKLNKSLLRQNTELIVENLEVKKNSF